MTALSDKARRIEAILDVCGMAEQEGVATLLELLEQGVLDVHPPLPRQSSRPPR